jgi:hypothetical protein
MSGILWVSISVSAFSFGSGEPDFVVNHGVGRPFKELNEQYHKSAEPNSCNSETSKCQSLFGKSCTCNKITVAFDRFFNRAIYTTRTSDDVVVEYNERMGYGGPLPVEKFYPTVNSFLEAISRVLFTQTSHKEAIKYSKSTGI